MDSEASLFTEAFCKNNSSETFSFEGNQVLYDDEPYSFIGTSNSLLGIAIAVASMAIPLFAVLIVKPIASEEPSFISLEPYGSKYSRSGSFTRISQHSC